MNWQKQRQHVLDRLAFLPGGTDREGNALLVVSTSQVQECSYENLVSLLALLSDTLPPSTLFTVLLDTRHIHLKQLKFYLRACQQALYKKMRQVLIIQPEKFLEQQKINFDLIVCGYTSKTVLISMHKLSKFVDVNQLPEQFGGTLGYDPDAWLSKRIEIKKWQNYLAEVDTDGSRHNPDEDQTLDEFVSKLQATKLVEDEYAAKSLKKSIRELKAKEEENSKEGLIKDHTAGVSDFLDWIEGSGEKWLNSLCQVADNVDEAEGLVKQHEELTNKTKVGHIMRRYVKMMALSFMNKFRLSFLQEIEEQSHQLAEIATRLMAACPQVAIVLQKTREQIRDVAEHFSYRVEAQTQFAVSNKNFREKVGEFIKKSDQMLEKVCAEDEKTVKPIEELTSTKKELDELVNSMNVAYESAMDAGEDTVAKARQYAEVLPAEEFVAHIASSLNYLSQKQNRHNELASVKRLEQQQHIQLMTTYEDCDQAIKWLGELKKHFTESISTYQYGKQLLSMAKNSERSSMKEGSTEERKEKLEAAWKELDLAIQNNEQRLKVVESFMATHRQVIKGHQDRNQHRNFQMMERVNEIERSLRERLRVSGKLNSITLSTERKRLRHDVDELSKCGNLLSTQINADHTTTAQDRQNAIKQISDKIDEVMTAQRRMESLIGEEEEAGSSSSGKEKKQQITSRKPFLRKNIENYSRYREKSENHTPRKSRPLSKVPEEEGGDLSPVFPRAVRLLETNEGIAPAIRLSKNESYL
ncbi:Protein CBG08262 [Caenorhabditis briggsae]|uniref:Protein CBG08262 n=1 Tax=Caenorhabditis briggsae TaxID=6238 RepID=A8X660_CAEBR|nr:Protein CBG08262 [Caenorhabditis briggsae]CAP28121.2 Protein CBG08262 [Caenorhabditis briggsae]